MSWNYRVVKTKHKYSPPQPASETIETVYAIHEVGYGIGEEKDVDELPIAEQEKTLSPTWTVEPSAPETYLSEDKTEEEAIKSLRWILEMMLKALDKPVIDGGFFDESHSSQENDNS